MRAERVRSRAEPIRSTVDEGSQLAACTTAGQALGERYGAAFV